MASVLETYVLFELAGATYAIPSSNVQHIEMLEHITLVPNAHRAIEGVVFSRGQVFPALNLRARFGFPRQDPSIRTRVIFARMRQRVVGLIVDSAREFKKFPSETIRPIEQSLTGIAGNYLQGVTTVNDRLVLVLDLEAALNLDQDESLSNSFAEIINRPAVESAPSATQTS